MNDIPLKAIIAEGISTICKQACNLIGKKAEYLLADRKYDVDYVIDDPITLDMKTTIPPKNWKDKDIITLICIDCTILLKIFFLHMKGIATRYAKPHFLSLLTAIQIKCLLFTSLISSNDTVW